MVLPVVGCTIGIATCEKSKQEGAVFNVSFVGLKMSGEFAQTNLVTNFIAS